jgi:hypothetical protein
MWPVLGSRYRIPPWYRVVAGENKYLQKLVLALLSKNRPTIFKKSAIESGSFKVDNLV